MLLHTNNELLCSVREPQGVRERLWERPHSSPALTRSRSQHTKPHPKLCVLKAASLSRLEDRHLTELFKAPVRGWVKGRHQRAVCSHFRESQKLEVRESSCRQELSVCKLIVAGRPLKSPVGPSQMKGRCIPRGASGEAWISSCWHGKRASRITRSGQQQISKQKLWTSVLLEKLIAAKLIAHHILDTQGFSLLKGSEWTCSSLLVLRSVVTTQLVPSNTTAP